MKSNGCILSTAGRPKRSIGSDTMGFGSEHTRFRRRAIWSWAFLLFSCLLFVLAGFLLWRNGRGMTLLITAAVAIAIALLEWRAPTDPNEAPAKDSSRRQTGFAMALVAAVSAAVYFPTLGMYFLADDFAYVQLYSDPSLGNFLRLLTIDQSQGIWGYNAEEFRPLGGLSYMLDYWLSGTNAVGYHRTAVLLHALSSLAVFGIARTAAGMGTGGAAFAGLAFGLLPIHSESVAWINGSRVDALPSMFYLAGFFGFARFRATGSARYLAFACAGFLGSLMSKEIAVTFPAMLISYDFFRRSAEAPASLRKDKDSLSRWRATLLPYLPMAVLFVAYLTVRAAIFDSVLREGQGVFRPRDAFASAAGFRAQFGSLWMEFARLQEFNAAQFLIEFPPVAVAITLGVLVAWAVLLPRTGMRGKNAIIWTLYFGGVWYLVASLPLLITYRSPRHLYLPAAGPCIALACLAAPGWSGAPRRRGRLTRVVTAVVLLTILGVLLWRQNSNWVRAGQMSATLTKDFPAALEGTPEGALVIAWAPSDHNKAYVWAWVLPAALQEPFMSRDLYSEARMVEFPDMYCCPLEQWWERKRPILIAILSGDPEAQTQVHRLAWDERSSAVSRLRVSLPRRQLRELVEEVLGGPVESALTISYDTAIKLMSLFMDLTAQGQ